MSLSMLIANCISVMAMGGGLNYWILDQQYWGQRCLGRLQVMYQVSVLVYRSSIAVVRIRYFWVLSIVQVRVLTEELVYKSRVQLLLLSPYLHPFLPSSFPPDPELLLPVL